MRVIIATTQFRRDIKRMKKRGYDMQKLHTLIEILVQGMPLASKYQDHALTGKWSDHRDCHIMPDWLLIYRLRSAELILVRTGTHSDLFKK